MKQQRRRAARAECVIRKCYFELAWMEQSQAGIKAAFTRATFLQRDSTIFYA